jgi:hypothetical protein
MDTLNSSRVETVLIIADMKQSNKTPPALKERRRYAVSCLEVLGATFCL